jgi:hypothetical protein
MDVTVKGGLERWIRVAATPLARGRLDVRIPLGWCDWQRILRVAQGLVALQMHQRD